MKKILGIVLIIPFLGWILTRILFSVQFEVGCEGHMKRAADANSVELAIQEMRMVVTYIESKKLTHGYTSIVYNTPDEDVGFWYKNMRSSLEELQALDPKASSLEKSNVLMKLRETLLDHGESTGITVPDGISIFPLNLISMITGVVTAVFALVGFIIVGIDEDW